MKFHNIPKELKLHHNFVVCRKDSKTPLQALIPKNAHVDDSTTWSSYINAFLNVNCGYSDYIGYVFNDNGYIGIDVDKCIDDNGKIDDDVLDLIKSIGSYTEYSKSKKGIHIIVKGNINFNGKKVDKFEIYKNNRFFILTGDVINNQYKLIENQKAVDELIIKLDELDTKEFRGNDTDLSIYKTSLNGTKLNMSYNLDLEKGSRNVSLIKIGGMLVNCDLSYPLLISEIHNINNKCCKPPLTKKELKNVMSSINKYYERRNK